MGNGNNKDGFVDMILETSKPIYIAGQFVQGIVHIDCKDSRNYRSLQIKLEGMQYVYWSEGSGKHRRTYSNRRQTYTHLFDLAIFADGIIAGGQYSFPFKFLLPSQLSGTMFQSQSCYIRYYLSSQLISSDGKNDTQIYSKVLNVKQPPRLQIGLIQKQQINSPQCCGCCKGYGQVKITMSCNKNYVKSGDQVKITVFVDNSAGTQSIQNIQVHFNQKRWKISSGGAIRNHTTHNTTFYVHPNVIQKGMTDQFSFNAMIPNGLLYSTAIGSILSKYHTLSLTSNMGCCANSPVCQFLLLFQSTSQQIEISAKIPPPAIWIPKIANQMIYTNMPPFIYVPTPSIPYLNRANMNQITNAMNFNPMPTQQGYYDNGVQQTQQVMY